MMLRGGFFSRGWQNVSIAYRAGYQVSGETLRRSVGRAIISCRPRSPMALSPATCGVAYADGVALTCGRRESGQGQYALDGVGGYHLSAADAGQTISLNYGYVPSDLARLRAGMGGRPLSLSRAHRHDLEKSRRPGDCGFPHLPPCRIIVALALRSFARDHCELNACSTSASKAPSELSAQPRRLARCDARGLDRKSRRPGAGALFASRRRQSGRRRPERPQRRPARFDPGETFSRRTALIGAAYLLQWRCALCGDPGIRRQDRGA